MESNTPENLKNSNTIILAFPFDVKVFRRPSKEKLENLYFFYSSLFYPIDDSDTL